jgi:hypothetical protein
MSQEQQKNVPNWESANKFTNRNNGFMLLLLPEYSILNAHRADLNTHRASSKHIKNKNFNLNDFGA